MTRLIRTFCAIVAVLAAAPALAQTRGATCYVFVEEGASADGNSMYLNKMGLPAEALSRVAPTRFSFAKKEFSLEAAGSFSYEAGTPALLGRTGRLALYSVAIQFQPHPLPRVWKTVSVAFSLKDVLKGKDFVQPAAEAIRRAALQAGVTSGLAWIVDMQMPTKGNFRAKVSLAK